jgi:hypothetical protein
MGLSLSQRHCDNCGRETLHTRKSFSVGLGILLTILTGGLFLPVWVVIHLALYAGEPWTCQNCGR